MAFREDTQFSAAGFFVLSVVVLVLGGSQLLVHLIVQPDVTLTRHEVWMAVAVFGAFLGAIHFYRSIDYRAADLALILLCVGGIVQSALATFARLADFPLVHFPHEHRPDALYHGWVFFGSLVSLVALFVRRWLQNHLFPPST